jgi:type VI secretion system secreted protein Hcp
MAVDMFLDMFAIKGESGDKAHKDTIDVLAWSWGMSQSGTMHVGGGGGAGKANYQDVSITKWVDRASTDLMAMCAKGTHHPKAQLIVRKAGGEQLEYIVIDMVDVIVSSVSTGGSGGEDRLTENVSLNFASVKVTYTPQADTGEAEPEVVFQRNIRENSDDVKVPG